MPFIDENYCKKLLDNQEVHDKACSVDITPDSDEAFERIMRWVQVRDRSSKEVSDRLSRAGFCRETIEAALERAYRCGALDDARFGETLVLSRLRAGKGKYGIEFELEKHQINSFDIPGWPERFFPDEEMETKEALSQLLKRPPTAQNKRGAAYRRLISKGYSPHIATRAARLWIEGI